MEERFAMAIRQRNLLADYIKKNLDQKRHFYQVPGSDKPSLNKDGAEVIGMAHGLKPRYVWVGGPLEPPEDDRPYQITLNCQLFNSRGDSGEGLGSASSHITKRNGQRVPRQPDPGLRHNSTVKMAAKSAYICATLAATAASEFFTQDGPEDGTAFDSSEPETYERGLCPVHKVAFLHREGTAKATGKAYDFWACPEKTTDGKYCQERPSEIDEAVRVVEAATTMRSAQTSTQSLTPRQALTAQFAAEVKRVGWPDEQVRHFLWATYHGSTGWASLNDGQMADALKRLKTNKDAPKTEWDDLTSANTLIDATAGEV
ncbi:MAG: hypothetical protein O3A47_13560 [Chloroflexi bacterium]|nr:hypothetical protein [Chloroflexota bacterium]